MTDQQLIQKFLDGEISAFNTLVWRWQNKIYNFILRYLGNHDEAQDLCQKTFIRVYKNLHRLRDYHKFNSWIYQIALNICRDELKSKKRNHTQSLEDLKEKNNGRESLYNSLESNNILNPERDILHNDLKNVLYRALQAIPEEQRVVIIMKEYDGLKFTEIADILQISVNTAKSRMYYGLSALKKIFDNWKITEEMLRHEM
ncbi:MAG: sigma-70 family RNA polymerase sigma factor [Calditrichaeota bacterium]|nr:MAG: sigma-70 family RNA polymerase sigma factor [Calditrichota bacterium]